MQNALNATAPLAANVPMRAELDLHVVIADGVFDLVCESRKLAREHAKDLREMGFVTRLIPVKSWQEADRLEDKMRGY